MVCCASFSVPEEIVAHSSSVACLALGKNSGRLLATGGEDCRVNIWAVSKPNCIMVQTSQTFREEVCVYSLISAYFWWMLPVTNSYFHLSFPFSFPLSLSLSQSLTGHNNPVECVKFNNSEEQVVAGSQSGSLRVWDLEAAKSETAFLLYCVWRG